MEEQDLQNALVSLYDFIIFSQHPQMTKGFYQKPSKNSLSPVASMAFFEQQKIGRVGCCRSTSWTNPPPNRSGAAYLHSWMVILTEGSLPSKAPEIARAHGMISTTGPPSSWLEVGPHAIFKLNRHKCTLHRKTWSILRCHNVPVAKWVWCTCRSTQLANHFFARLRDSWEESSKYHRCPSAFLLLLLHPYNYQLLSSTSTSPNPSEGFWFTTQLLLHC